MRNLKKLLSLALALVMMLGMLTVASAADEEAKIMDMDTVSASQKEAIQLLVDLGIVVGTPREDGNYIDPQASIDRNSFAKVVFMALEKSDNADLFKGSSVLADVQGTWAEGFVNYLNALGIVSGDLEGNFLGGNALTVVTASKIMLVAMGYNALDRGYEQDANWSTNILRDARNNGLLTGVTQANNTTEDLTRENAFRIIYNALFAPAVTAITKPNLMGTGRYIDSYEPNGTLGLNTYNMAQVSVNVGSDAVISGATIIAPAGLKGVAGANFSLNATLLTDAAKAYTFAPETIGSTATFFVVLSTYNFATTGTPAAATYKELASSEPSVGASNVISKTYGNITLANLANSAATAYVADYAASVAVYNNGTAVTWDDDSDGGTTPEVAVTDLSNSSQMTVVAALIKRGVIVELLDNNLDGKFEIVRLTTKTFARLTDNLGYRTNASSGVAEVNIPGVGGWQALTAVSGYEGLKKGDHVLYADIAGVRYYEKAVSVEGKKTAYTPGGTPTMTFAGTKYAASALSGVSANNVDSDLGFTATYEIFIDDGKNLLKSVALTEDTSSNYAYVLASKHTATDAWGNAVGTAEVQLLFTDGTTEAVPVGTYDGSGTLGTTEFAATTGTIIGKFVNFGISNGKYNLTLATSGTDTLDTLTAQDFVKGAPSLGTKGTSGTAYGDAGTLFLIAKTENGVTTYTPYTGIANAPSMDDFTAKVLLKSTGIARIVVVSNVTNYPGTVGEYVYFASAAYSVDVTTNRTYASAYTNGVAGAVVTTAGASNLPGAAGELREVTARNGEIVTAFGSTDLLASLETITTVGSSVVTIGSTTYTFDADTVVYVIAKADKSLSEGSTSDLSSDGTYKAYVNGTGNSGTYLKVVYLVEQ